MGTTPQAPPSPPVSQAPASQRTIHTAQLITAMLKSNGHVSDLIFSPGRAPQIEVSGELVELKFKGLESLSPDDTHFIAYDIIGKNDTSLPQARTGWLRRSFLRAFRCRPLSREHFSPARHVRDRDARDSGW